MRSFVMLLSAYKITLSQKLRTSGGIFEMALLRVDVSGCALFQPFSRCQEIYRKKIRCVENIVIFSLFKNDEQNSCSTLCKAPCILNL